MANSTKGKSRNPFPLSARPKLMNLASASGPKVYMPADIIGNRYFSIAVAAAVLLHIAGIIVWHLMPKQEIIEVPVRALNIKLGDAEFSAAELKAVSPDAATKAEVEASLAPLVRDASRDNARTQAVVKSMEKAMNEMNKAAAEQTMLKHMAPDARSKNVIKQYVRPTALQGNDSAKGAQDKEIVQRYEQLISLWIQKFKLYPEEARRQGMEGETIIRVRIDRRGNIHHYLLERSTGYPLLDRAAIDMIRRSNPVPAVPNDYPPGDELEFLIPVNFRLQ